MSKMMTSENRAHKQFDKKQTSSMRTTAHHHHQMNQIDNVGSILK
jgi:hypothetical protein